MEYTLVNEDIKLRLVNRADQQKVFEGLSNTEVIKYFGISYTTFEETAKQIDWYEKSLAENTGFPWVIENIKSNEFMGIIGMYNISNLHHHAEVGYWLFPQFQGKGYAYNALQMVMHFAQFKLNIHRLIADLEPENTSSIKLLSKNGFEHEGTKRDCEYKNGKYISLQTWSKLFPINNH